MNDPSSNGSEGRAPGAVSNAAQFVRDLIALIELQGMLLAVEAGDEFRKLRFGLLSIIVLSGLGLSCLPVGLAGLALLIAEHTRLSIAESLLLVAFAGMPAAGAGIYVTFLVVKPGEQCLKRSRREWKFNVNWIKDALKHLGDRHNPDRSRAFQEQIRP